MIPLVVRVEDLDTGASAQYAFIRSPVRIGRSEINDLPLPQGFVSTWHAVVQFDDQTAQYADLGSTNGSILNGERIATNAPMPLEPGAEVRIGTIRLTFARRATGERPAVPRQATMFAMKVADRARPATAPATTLPGMPGTTGLRPAAPGRVTGLRPAAPPPAAIPDLSREVADAAVEAAALDLDLLYASWRGAWDHLRSRLDELLAGLDSPARQAAVLRLSEKYAALTGEAQFREMGGAPPPAPSGPAAPAARGSEVEGLLAAFAESYLPAGVRAGQGRAEDLLDRVAEVLETFGRSYVEMRKGYEEFGKEMGVRTVHGDGPVEKARDARQLLAYLLDPARQAGPRELQSAFADLMVHQVALLKGVVEGGKALLARLDPEAIASGASGIMKAQAMWKTFEERWREIVEEESAIQDLLFGKEFARAYTGMVGGKGDGGREGERPKRR